MITISQLHFASDDVRRRAIHCSVRTQKDGSLRVDPRVEGKAIRRVRFFGREVDCSDWDTGEVCDANSYHQYCYHTFAAQRRRLINEKRRKTLAIKRARGENRSMSEVICPCCNRQAELVSGDIIYPRRPDLAHKKFWLCAPCDARVGCHAQGDGTRPLGRLANAELRVAKQAAHAAFDPLWRSSRSKRSKQRKAAYAWLAEMLGIARERCHIGEFDVDLCRRTERVCHKLKGE